MKPRYLILGVVAAVVVALAIYASTRPTTTNDSVGNKSTSTPSPSSSPTPTGTPHPGIQPSNAGEDKQIIIQNNAFSQPTITIKKGAKLTWRNVDSTAHNIVADGPNAASGPKSELLAQGESYTFTFTKTGSYHYHCTPHPAMQGTVIVTD